MFGPTWAAGCPSCSVIADGFDGVGAAPGAPRRHAGGRLARTAGQAAGVQAADGLELPLGLIAAGDFNFDFNVSFTEAQQQAGEVEYNYARGSHAMDAAPVPEPVARFAASCGTDPASFSRDRPGLSAFALEDGAIYHTYSTYARGLDAVWSMYPWLDRAPLGRNETGPWWRRHDEYGPN